MHVHYFDMHSGGRTKNVYEHIIIEANSEKEADIIFYNRFGSNPHRVTCTCCGSDYSVDAFDTLEECTECWGKDYLIGSLSAEAKTPFLDRTKVLLIEAKDIDPDERVGILPEQGYVWRD